MLHWNWGDKGQVWAVEQDDKVVTTFTITEEDNSVDIVQEPLEHDPECNGEGCFWTNDGEYKFSTFEDAKMACEIMVELWYGTDGFDQEEVPA